MDTPQFEATLMNVEVRLRRLRTLYDQYFAGVERTEPHIERTEVERLIDLLRKSQPRNTALRFRFNQIVQRYTTYNTFWQRTRRQIEEGTFRRDVLRARRRFGDARARKERGLELTIDVEPTLDSLPLEDEAANADAAVSQPAVSDSGVAAMASAAAEPVPQPVGAALRADPPDAEASRVPPRPLEAPARSMPPPKPALPTVAPAAGPSRANAPVPLRPPPAPGGKPLAVPPPVGHPMPPASAVAPAAARPGAPPPPAAAGAKAPVPGAAAGDPASKPAATAPRPAPAAASPPPQQPKAPAKAPAPKPAAASPAPSAAGPSDAQIEALYQRYIEARRKNQERTDNVKVESIAKTVRDMIPKLAEKHAGKRIDFEVVLKDGRVALKPVTK